MMHGCGKCSKIGAVLMLLVGVAFLLVDKHVWHFWDLSWWTVLFLLLGLGGLASGMCKDCQTMKKK